MFLLRDFRDRLRRRAQNRKRQPIVDPHDWLHRNRIVSSLAVLVLLAGFLVWWSPWRTPSPCGRGLTAVGSPYVCVGLDLDSTGFKGADPLAGMEHGIADQNSKLTGQFATIVLLDDMTPDPVSDSVDFHLLEHSIEGAVTASWRSNNRAVARGALPKIKLLLANYGGSAAYWPQAVDAIKRADNSDPIVTLAGIGQSPHATRAAGVPSSR